MTTFNTGNPIGSFDTRDRADNTQNLDLLVNGTAQSYPDRLGVSRKSWKGFEVDFAAFLAASGFELPALDYVDGTPLVVARPTQLIDRDGILYSVKPTESFPATLTGTWATDQTRVVVRTDQDLRQDLADVTGDPEKGAGIPTFDDEVEYVAGSVGAKINEIITELAVISEGSGYPVRLIDYASAGVEVSQTSGVQAALDTGASVVDGGGLRFRIDTSVYLKAGQVLQNVVLDFSNGPTGGVALYAQGTKSAQFAINTASEGGLNFTLTTTGDAANFAVNDYIRLLANNVFDASNTNTKVGEINKAAAVNLGTGVITCGAPRALTYSTSPKVEKLSMLSGAVLKNSVVIGAAASENGQTALTAEYCIGLLVDNCAFFRFDSRAAYFLDCVGCSVRNSKFYRARPTAAGYGISFADATQDCNATGNYFEDVRHSLSTNNTSERGGVVKRIVFSANNVYISAPAASGAGGDAIDTHGAAMDVIISDNTVYGASGQGINVECAGATVTGNTVVRSASNGIQVRNETDRPCSFVVSDNTVMQSGSTGIVAIPGIRGGTAGATSLIVSDNLVETTTASGIQVGNTAGLRMENVVLSGNAIKNAGSTGYLLQNIDGLAVSGNTLNGAGAGSSGLRIVNSKKFGVTGNTILHTSSVSVPILIIVATTAGDTNNGLINGNVLQTATGTTTQFGVSVSSNAQYIGVFCNNVRGTGNVSLGTGTGNSQANNIL